MANQFASFTITQPFLGAALQFQPALGSAELDRLIDAFVTGSASRKDKLSEVTIDFYNHATVDLNTGSLVRRYDVALPFDFEQSPTLTQSSGFSPAMYTPSPASSATFADSGYGSISMTPPNRNRVAASARVSKKPKKETKKGAEVRLPGFSIMTKDGIDVTSTAGRGTKTKEQREHAHLMRIMKACDDCKRKKVRCDPSHRRGNDTMARSSTSTSTSSSSRPNPSPTVVPSFSSNESSYNSLYSYTPPSFGTNAIDDFVLFPEGTNSYWNPADTSFDSQCTDLGQFNFDMNDSGLLGDFSAGNADQFLDFSTYDQSSGLQQATYTPLVTDQYGLGAFSQSDSFALNVSRNVTQSNPYGHALTLIDQWASSYGDQQPAVHTRPHPSSSTQGSGQSLDSNWSSDSLIPSSLSGTDQVLPGGSSTSPTSFSSDQLLMGSNSSLSPTRAPSSSSNPQHLRSANVSSLLTHANQSLSNPGLSDLHSDGYGQTLSSTDMYFSDLENTYAEIKESLRSLQASLARHRSFRKDLFRLRKSIDLLKSGPSDFSTSLATADVMSQLHDLTLQLQVIAARVRNLGDLATLARQGYNGDKRPISREAYIKECQVNARRLVRSLCATINSVQVRGSKSSSPSSASNTAILTSGRKVQLEVSSLERHNRAIQSVGAEMQSNSNAGYDSSIGQSSTSHSSYARYGVDSRYGVVLREDEIADLISQGDVYEDADDCGCHENGSHSPGHTTVATTSRRSQHYNLTLKEAVSPLTSPQESSLHDQSCLLDSFGYNPGEQQRRTTLDGVANKTATVIPPTNPRSVPTPAPFPQPGQLSSALSEGALQPLSASSEVLPARTVGSSRSTSLVISQGVSSRGAIPRTVLSQLTTPLAVDESQLGTAGLDVKYRMLVALVLTASLVILINLTETTLPYAIALSLVAVVFPRLFSPVPSISMPLVACFTLSLLALSSLPSIDRFRETLTQWIDIDSFTGMAKLLLCCTFIAQPPATLWKNMRFFAPIAAAASWIQLSPKTTGGMSSSRTPSTKHFNGNGKAVAGLFELLSHTVRIL